MKKRIFAFLMAMMMLISAVPAEVLATALEGDAGTELYFIDDAIWLPEGEEPAAPVVETGEWVKTEETMVETQLVCPEAEHAHHYNCPVDAEGNYTCDGGEDHVHVTDGCASDCAVAEHTHGETCYQQTTKVKWTVALKEDAAVTYAPPWWGGDDDEDESDGSSGNGTDLGWDCAIITGSQSEGFELDEESENWGNHLTVTINGTTVSEYNSNTNNIVNGVLASDASGTVAISVKPGSPYYISEMILACGNNDGTPNPFNCRTKGTSDAYTFPISGTPTSITANLSTIYTVASHGSHDDDYFVMIELAPLPAPVYVGYDSGKAGDHVIAARPVSETGSIEYTASGTAYTATPVGGYPTWSYPTAASTHNALGISPEAEAEANTHGYSFAGWHLEYYTVYTDSTNTFSGEMSVGGTNLFRGANVTLTVHAKLTAIWQPMDTISVSKVWEDSDNLDGIRPGSVVIHLLRNGIHNGNPVTLSASNNWSATWNVPSKDEDGNAIAWSVEEVVPAGYTSSVTGNAANGFVVTNIHVLERTSTHVQKIWNDDNNRDGIRPYGVQVQLYCNGEAVTSYTDASGNEISGTATLTAENSWSHEWLGLAKNKPGAVGQASTYTVQEIGYVDKDGNAVENPGYTVSQGTDAETGVLLITNTHQSATMDIPVEKVWSDSDNRDGKRPGSVTVTLTANGVATDKSLVLSEENEWKGVFEDVYVNANGTPIHYSVVEKEVAGYTVKVTGNSADGFVVTNSHTPETTSVPVTKVWNDGENQDGIRPVSVELQLYADGVEVEGKKLTLKAADNWQGSFAGLPKYRTGKVGEMIVYTVEETGHTDLDAQGQEVYTAAVPEGYEVTVNGTTVTNTHAPEVVKLDVEKVWDDVDNQDGIRPFAVVITLYVNGQATDKTLTLSADNNWKASWEKLPRFNNGQRISYSVVETGYIQNSGDVVTEGVPKGYTVDHDYTGENTNNHKATVTNIHKPVGTDLNVQKIWDDDDNRAGKRPAEITVELYADGVATGKKLTLNAANEWDDTFTNLPVYSGGKKIVYTVVETALDSELGYEAPIYSNLDETLRLLTVTNKRADEKVSVTVIKEWNDKDNQDNIRPDSVTVTLYANGIDAKVSRTLDASNNWTATFADLYKHYNGKDVVYTVVETAVSGYEATYSEATDTDGNVRIVVKNTHVPEVISIPVTKTWSDGDDRDGIRPSSVTITLYADGEKKEELELKEEDNWQGSFDNLPRYLAGEIGQEIVYTVVEDAVPGYNVVNGVAEAVRAGVVDGKFSIENVHEVEKTSIKVNKKWNDEDDQDRVRPTSIKVYLYANGTLAQTATLNAAGNWSHEWTDLFKYEEGKEINYTVYEETLSDGYSATIERIGNEITITNTRNVNKTTFTVQKIWDDANNQDNVRYDGVAVQLYANGIASGEPVVLKEDSHWRYTWADLDVNKLGDENPITYTVAEVYYVTIDDLDVQTRVELDENEYTEGNPVKDSHTGIVTITNTHKVQKTSVAVKKVWDDAEDQDQIRPASVTVQLYKNGQAVTSYTYTDSNGKEQKVSGIVPLNEENGWTATFDELDVHHGIGVDNVYTVVEVVPVPDDAGNAVTDSNWNPTYEPGVPSGYVVSYGTDNGKLVVINTHEVYTVSIPVIKNWTDNDDQDGIRPDSIVVRLYADGVATGDTLTVYAADNWQGAFTDLPKNKDGVAIAYTVVEDAVPGYNVVDGVAQTVSAEVVDGMFSITNEHTPAVTEVYAQKIWDDKNDQDDVRPNTIELHLLANGEHMGEAYVIVLDGTADTTLDNHSEVEAWKARWTNLPKNKQGNLITYTVREKITSEMTTDGYAASYPESETGVAEGVQIVRNTRRVDTITFVAKKIWNDANNQDGMRPYAVVLELYKNGQTTGLKETVTAADDWTFTWTELDKNVNGASVQYTAKEVGYYATEADLDSQKAYESGLPADYSVSYPNSETVNGSVYQITNSRTVDKIEVKVTKAWDDNHDQDGVRPNSVTVTLYCNGQPTEHIVTLSEENNWSETISGLEKNYALNVPNVYTVVETEIPAGYTVEYASQKDDTTGNIALTVTNTHTPEVVSIPVMKEWSDANDQDGKRPEAVEITLYADDAAKEIFVLHAGNNWRHTFAGLAKKNAGNVIVYTVKETGHYDKYDPSVDTNIRTDGVHEAYAANDGNAENSYKITNTHTPEKTAITATKVWDDANNQDGKRPASIILHLLANGKHTEKTATLSKDKVDKDGNWVYEWTDLPVYEEGKKINYTVYEQRVDENGEALQWVKDGYVSSNSRTGNDVIITNTRAVEKTAFSVQKVWNDANNQDNVRYAGVVVQLYANGEESGETVELNVANRWRYNWTGLDKNKDGSAIAYKVKELYYLVINDSNEKVRVELDETHYAEPKDGLGTFNQTTGITAITNNHDVQKIKVAVRKVWDDADNQDGIRPFSVTVELYRNGQPTGQTAELKADSWSTVFDNLDVHHGIGVDNVYTIVETGYAMTEGDAEKPGIPAGYAATYTVTSTAADGSMTVEVKNTHTPAVISVPVSKVWDDNKDQDGIRPDSITVQLYAGDKAVEGKLLTLDANKNWQGSFDDLPKFKNGTEIKYTVKEVGHTDVDDNGNAVYTAKVPENYSVTVADGIITNTHTPAKINLNVEKIWNDVGNQDGKRPFAVVVTLYANGRATDKTLTLNAANEWKGVWSGMPLYHNGQRISYTVVESGYIQKEGDEVTHGIPVGYTVTHSYQAVNEDGEAYARITNSYTPELTDLNVQKVWDDDDNRAGKRPASVTVTLVKKIGDQWVPVLDGDNNNNPMTTELNPSNEWDHTFTNLPKYSGGQLIQYNVVETALDSKLGYEEPTYKLDAATRVVTVTNTRHDEKISVHVNKVWDDADNQDGIRPDSITVTLYANGIKTSASVVLTEQTGWSGSFEDLHKHYKGKDVVYTVVETAVDGYTAEYTTVSTAVDGSFTLQVKNTHEPELISLPVTKLWDDADNQDGIRPDSITVTLYVNGVSTGKTAVLSIDNNWEDNETFVDLPKFAGGQEIAYTVVENAVEGYNVTDGKAQSITVGVVNGEIRITNVHAPEKTKVTAVKVWDDANDQDGIRPDSIKVHLLADGVHTGKSVELTEAKGWTCTWENLDKYAAGREIVYTVYEEIVAKGAVQQSNSRAITDYTASYAHDPKDHNRITITNSYIPETQNIAVLKVWDDGANRDGLRPESVKAELYADGIPTGKVLVLSEENSWTSTWTNMPKYRDHGKEIVYSVVEVSALVGYEVKIVRDTEVTAGMFIITNSHTPATTGVSVNKIWDDENDNDGKRPDGIVVQLYANGSAVEGARVELNAMNNWSHVWHSSDGHPLYVFDKGEEISYYADEVGYVIDGKEYDDLPDGYTKTVSTKDYSTSITNTRETEKIDVSVEKLWVDSDNNDGIRPAVVSITLYCNGEAMNTVALSTENSWTHTWTDLYKYVAGEEAEYTIKETEVAGYTASYASETKTNGSIHWTVTNTHEIETKDVTVTKVWKDNNNAEGYRPESVKVRLYKNGKVYGSTITLSKKNDWKYQVTLPVYENGTEIVWTIAETKIPKYYSASYNHKTLTVTNTIQSKEIPKTGDESNLLFWMGTMLLSCAGAAAVLFSDRKRRTNRP